MGMFDEVKFQNPKMLKSMVSEEDFAIIDNIGTDYYQTKDFDNMMDYYIILENGRICSEDRENFDLDYHGYITIYTFPKDCDRKDAVQSGLIYLKLKFTDGHLSDIKVLIEKH